MTLLLTEDDARKLTSVTAAIPTIEEAFRILGNRRAYTPPRERMPTGFDGQHYHEGFLQLGPAAMPTKNLAGYKMFANFGSRDLKVRYGRAWNYLFDLRTGELLGIFQAHFLSNARTAATSGVAAKYLSPSSASTVGLFGPGKLAEGQLEAICAVRAIKQAFIHGRNKDKCDAFAKEAGKRFEIDVSSVDRPEDAAAADIIITCTSSFEPIFFGDWLKKPGLLIGVGANHWNRRELDESVFKKADLIVADERETAKVESGALKSAVHNGIITWDKVENLADIVAGRLPFTDFDKSTTVFCSHGLALEDVAISAQVYEEARRSGVGRDIDV